MDSHDNIISNNSVNYNILSGINVQWKSSNNYISNNSVNFNKMDGINLGFVDDNYIVRNFIRNNVIYGLDIDSGSDNNTIYENIFINNEQNARDYGTDNQWDNGTIGNYWDDYTGVDANDDGIGDLPYNISGTAGSQDRFPIFQDSDEDDDDGGDDGGDDGIPNPGESIPGYDIVFLIGALSCIILIVLRKQGKLKTLK